MDHSISDPYRNVPALLKFSDSSVTQEIIQTWSELYGYRYRIHGSSPLTVIVGENYHKTARYRAHQSIVSQVKPTYLLHQSMGSMIYDASREGTFPQGEKFDKDELGRIIRRPPRRLVQLAKRNSVSLVGTDISHSQRKKLSTRPSMLASARKSKLVDVLMEYRHKTNDPIIAIVDEHYLHHASTLHQKLQKSDFHYIWCIPR
ncbi:hypothetical protein KW805_00055 [Candidatus Pacearchaeota archaeon]|nr:hypothetical protein [Candidatus Pacearchaeota archaeon]